MKTVTVAQMRELDRRAIEDYRIPSILLMENAGLRTADFIHKMYGQSIKGKTIMIICGRGNNGGDGFVIARHLMNKGYIVNVAVLSDKNKIKGDAQINLDIFERMGGYVIFIDVKDFNEKVKNIINDSEIIVDAIFGTGLDRDIEEPIKTNIKLINQSQKTVVSVDAPSGLNCDSGAILGIAVKSDATVTMASAKEGFFKGEGPSCVGKVHVVDISIPKKILDEQ